MMSFTVLGLLTSLSLFGAAAWMAARLDDDTDDTDDEDTQPWPAPR